MLANLLSEQVVGAAYFHQGLRRSTRSLHERSAATSRDEPIRCVCDSGPGHCDPAARYCDPSRGVVTRIVVVTSQVGITATQMQDLAIQLVVLASQVEAALIRIAVLAIQLAVTGSRVMDIASVIAVAPTRLPVTATQIG